MKESAGKELLRVSKDKKFNRNLLKALIVQSLLRPGEPSVLLRCRKIDHKVTIDGVYLPPPKSGNVYSHEPFCSGGVVVASEDGKIVYENTLDARLETA
ncbi:V-type proton ATPase subunit E-like [Quillaja saponaria]|uniref:V-type proton ATPase subunit E-like n=1 Tax=Quillaja saponaria TaxID=32244 RepID=A0AAD7PC34_QUISA|nr:V-type proton ATPase subunit E-like [Quillaja saponaria]